jgi:hypothetical protein
MSDKGNSILKIGNVEPNEKHSFPPVAHPLLPQHPFSMLIVAPKGGGKTNLICHLLLHQYKGYYNRIVVCSPTLENDPKWELVRKTKGLLKENKKLEQILKGKPKTKKRWKVIFSNPDDEAKERTEENKFDGKIDPEDMFSEQHKIFPIIEHQQAVIEFLRDHDHEEDAKYILDRVLIILDDQAGLFKMSPSNNPLINFVLKHRHYSTSLIFVTQAYKAIPKAIRINMNSLILFEIPNLAELKAIYEEYPDKLEEEEWMQLYWHIIDSQPYSFFYFNSHFPPGQRIHMRFEHKFIINNRTETDNPLGELGSEKLSKANANEEPPEKKQRTK